jgi:hypothetical protein
VAAHSTVRALYGAYAGNLYQVKRTSDNTTKDIPVISAGGTVDASVQDKFCTGTACTISKIYDQSGKGNHLTSAPGGGAVNTPDKEVNAAKWNIQFGGQSAYAAYFEGGMGYRNNSTSGIATGDQPEGLYMVTSGTHYNDLCCFDYGNAETTNNDDGAGTMEAIYFGNNTQWGKGSGSGPWIMADMENALLGGVDFSGNPSNNSLTSEYVTAMVKGKSNWWAIRGGNAQSGTLTTMYDGIRPTQKDWTGAGYDPMRKQGAIILGIGGDNSNWSQGTFFEGAMTSGYPSDATDAAVQANIVAAGYGSSTPIVTIPAHRDSVFNGGFDLGTLGWTFNVWSGGAHGSVVNSEYKIQIDSIGQNNSSIQLVQNGIILRQGRSYEVKFDAYASANRTLEANVEQDVSPWTSYLPALQNFNLSTTKTTYSYAFTMTNPTDSNGRISFNAGASTEPVYLDNIAIKDATTGIRNKVEPPVNMMRWSAGAIFLLGTESGRLQIIDSRGRSRVVEIAGGKACIGRLPSGVYQAETLGNPSSHGIVVIP